MAEEFDVSLRTVQKDFNERLNTLYDIVDLGHGNYAFPEGYVVVIDYDRYMELIAKNRVHSRENWIEETFGVMSTKESEELINDISKSRVNKESDLWS